MTRLGAASTPGVLILLWIPAVLLGAYQLALYSNTPTETAEQPVQWPRESKLIRSSSQNTLVLALHPRCACSRATLTELSKLVAQARSPLRIEILVYRPPGRDDRWEDTDITEKAHKIPGAMVHSDLAGIEASQFHMWVSGQVALYDAQGVLRFQGGITRSRGHEGDNAGRDAILASLNGETLPYARTPVFGCSLYSRG